MLTKPIVRPPAMRRVQHAAIALSVPIVMALGMYIRFIVIPGEPLRAEEFAVLVGVNALWFGGPHAVVCATALWKYGLAAHVVPILWCLNAFLVAFAIWVQTQYSARDGAFIWIAYIPAALVIALAYAAYRFHRSAEINPPEA